MTMNRGYYDVFMRTCARSPGNVAIRQYECGKYHTYAYSELYGVCEYVSQNLQQLKCNKGVIALVSEKNAIIPSVIAAAHKCCTSFIFLNSPQDIEIITGKIKLSAVIVINKNRDNVQLELFGKKPDTTASMFDLNILFYSCDTTAENNFVSQHSFIATTSGSTGEPKHIQVPIQCLQPNIDDLTKLFSITSKDVIYFSTPLTFDPSMVEILLACTNGASLLIAPDLTEVLFHEDNDNSVTFWQTTPSKFFQHSNENIKNKILCARSTLKVLALGGEPLNGIKILKELKHKNNKTRIFTLYGVTEMSCWASVAELDLNKVTTGDKEVPLGNCLSETELFVQPHEKNNTMGKIILASKTRKCILLNRKNGNKEENSIKFIDTGDIGEIRNGTVFYRGRVDDTIKRFGHKINLHSIESTVMQCPRVRSCSCVWLQTPLLLIVYFSAETLSSQELLDFLKCKLDEKYWPDKVIRVDTLPTNAHGKTSKEILVNIYKKSNILQNVENIKSYLFKELKALVNKDLNYEDLQSKSFFSLGGTSFLAVTICNKLSLTFPEVGKHILPHLLSHNKSIGDVLKTITQDTNCLENKFKKSIKRNRSTSSHGENSISYKKGAGGIRNSNTVEFVVQWTFDTGKCVDASPALYKSESVLYVTVGSHSGKIVVMNANTGFIQGLIKLKSRIEAPILCVHDECVTSPCGVVGTYDGTVICFLLENCSVIWQINVGSMIKSKATYCKGVLYIASYDGNIRCIDILTSTIKETVHVSDQAISADLVLAKNEFILFGTLSGVCACLHVNTKTIIWQGSLKGPIFACPVLYDNDKYVIFAEVNGEIHCRTVEKGIKIWTYNGAKGNIFSSLCVKEINKFKWQMYFGCHDNNVYSVNITNFQPSLHWKTRVSSPVYSTPTIFNDKLILAASTDGKLWVIHSELGTVTAQYQLPGETFSSPIICDDHVFIGCRNDLLYSLKIDTK